MDTTKKEVAADVGGLTGEQINRIARENYGSGATEQEIEFARAIEREVLATKAAAEAVHPVEQDRQVSGLDYPTTYADLARITPTALFNRWLGSRSAASITPRDAFLAARAIPAPAEQPSTAGSAKGGNTSIDTPEFRERLRALGAVFAQYGESYKRLVGYVNSHFLARVARQPAAQAERAMLDGSTALEGLEKKLARIHLSCRSDAPKLSVREMVADMLRMEEWGILRAAFSAAPAAQEGEQKGWCLEKGSVFDPLYLHASENGILDWTPENAKALRFARRADAESMVSIVEDADRVAEHMWVVAQEGEQGSDEEAYAKSGYRHFMSFEKFKDFRAGVIPASEQGSAQAAPADLRDAANDTERLDFMIAEECQVESLTLPSGTRYRLHWPHEEEAQPDWLVIPRAAIDTAIHALRSTSTPADDSQKGGA